ncbi:MAG: DUF6335 family protein [Candidatus Eisenbacteria bacterium]
MPKKKRHERSGGRDGSAGRAAGAGKESRPAARPLVEDPDATGTEEKLARAADGGIWVGDEQADAVRREFYEASQKGTGQRRFERELEEHTATSPAISGGDVDADWQREDIGEEAAGGSVATPDQDVVEEYGEALGVRYEDDEPLHTEEKIEERDRRRWELNPASDEEFQERQSWLAEDVERIAKQGAEGAEDAEDAEDA